MNKDFYEIIEKVIRTNIERRGFDKISFNGQLKKMTNALIESDSILILTGFCVESARVGETDGPPGAVALAQALLSLNKRIVIVSDQYSKELIIEGRKCIAEKFKIEIIKRDNISFQVKEIIHQNDIDHILAIERPGKNKEGKFQSMRGEDISAVVVDTDHFFYEAKKQGIPTSAIGDGGNELGMGAIKGYVENNIENGYKIIAVEKADNLLITTVSNWGAEGVIAALSILTNKNLLLSSPDIIKILQYMVDVGAVDGLTKQNNLTVDGFTLEENLEIHKQLNNIVDYYIN